VPELIVRQSTVTLDGAAGQQTQLLVGDVLGTGTDQLVVITGGRVQIFQISILPSGDLSYTRADTPSATGALDEGNNQILTALLGSNILTISSTNKNGKKTISFVVSAMGGPGVTSEIEDVLAGEGYVSVSWHRGGEKEVVEVFGWYGMLGARVFAMGDGGEFAATGVCATLGQVNTVGEILGWGPGVEWGDIEGYNPRPEM